VPNKQFLIDFAIHSGRDAGGHVGTGEIKGASHIPGLLAVIVIAGTG